MFLPRECELQVLFSVLALLMLALGAECGSPAFRRGLAGETVFDVTSYGAKPDAKTESALQLIRAWNAACQSGGPATLLIPLGSFLAGEVVFQGPCTGPMTIEIQGTLLSREDLSLYTSNIWITIQNVDGVTVTGGGTLNGQGQSAWEFDNGGDGGGTLLPLSLVLESVNNSAVQNIKFVDSKGFHMKITDGVNINVTNVNINAPGDSPNTDGIHISDSEQIFIADSVIGTGDDCVSIGDGNTNVTVFNITCGPGHGISVGSLGKRPDETDVKGILVKNCTFKGTTNGARIKTYHASPDLQASEIVYEDIIMEEVANPIIIDQHYNSKKKPEPSKVKISNVHFRNINGTTTTPIAISLNCSSAIPCEGIELANINLTPIGGISSLSTACSNVNPTVSGTMNPTSCQ